VVNAGVGEDGDAVADPTLEQPASVSAAITPAATSPDTGANFRIVLIGPPPLPLFSFRFRIITPEARAAIAGSATFLRRQTGVGVLQLPGTSSVM
jgi:hypothetical protein